jgi:polysaccharide biosynthesis/export protein
MIRASKAPSRFLCAAALVASAWYGASTLTASAQTPIIAFRDVPAGAAAPAPAPPVVPPPPAAEVGTPAAAALPPAPVPASAPAPAQAAPAQTMVPLTAFPSRGLTDANGGPRMLANCPAPEAWRCGVACACPNRFGGQPGWLASRPIPWQVFAQGEYIGPARSEHVREYRLRVDDQLQFVYRLTAKQSSRPYRLEVGDRVRVESLTSPELAQEVAIQPDGTITLQYLGQVPSAGRTVDELRAALDEQYKSRFVNPSMLVTPVKFNTRLEELRSSVDSRYGPGGQQRAVQVTPEGTVQLPAIGSIYVQGLTITEAKREVDERYAQFVDGVEVTPILTTRAPRYVYVVGEVRTPGRYTLEGPTTVMQSIALAGGWNNGANLRQMVVFRRDDCWRLMATKVNVHGALYGKRPCPADEIWLRDSDIVLVPKTAVLVADDAVNLLFTRGLYSVFPLNATINFAKLSSL